MTLTTSRDKTYEVVYVDGPTRLSGNVMIRMADKRPILEIGAEFDGLERFQRVSESQGNKEWTGYTQLVSIRRLNEADVLIELGRP